MRALFGQNVLSGFISGASGCLIGLDTKGKPAANAAVALALTKLRRVITAVPLLMDFFVVIYLPRMSCGCGRPATMRRQWRRSIAIQRFPSLGLVLLLRMYPEKRALDLGTLVSPSTNAFILRPHERHSRARGASEEHMSIRLVFFIPYLLRQ